MAYAPKTDHVTGDVVSAAQMNQIGANFAETAVGKAEAEGDTFYATGAAALSKLSIGTAGQVLRVNAGATAPEWGGLPSSIIHFGQRSGDSVGPSGTMYIGPHSSSASDAVNTRLVFPATGTVRNMYVLCLNSLSTATATFTARKNGSDQTLVVALAGGADDGSDTSNSFTVAAGDYMNVRITANSGGTGLAQTATVSCEFVPS